MVEVLKIGSVFYTKDPVTGKDTRMTRVTYVEEGRPGGGANSSLSHSSNMLSRALGVDAGLPSRRIHTQGANDEELKRLKVGQKIEGLFINRSMYTTAQMPQQVGVKPRMIDGKPTLFTTYLDDSPKDDQDFRMSVETTAANFPDLIANSLIGAAIVREDNIEEREAELAAQRSRQGIVPRKQEQTEERDLTKR